MGRKIITIGRQFGSGGHEIGKKLARRLNVPLYDRDIVEQAAKEIHLSSDSIDEVDEKNITHVMASIHRLLGYDRPYKLNQYSESVSDQLYRAQAAIIKKLADEGPCVMVGRCSDYILRDRDDVLSVFIYADKAYRIHRLRMVRGMIPENAELAIKETDKNRRGYYHTYTGRQWDSPSSYHIMFNSAHLGPDAIVDMLAKIYEAE